MTQTQIILIFILLLGVGLSLSANNYIHSLVINIFLHHDPLSIIATRVIGLVLIVSSLLFLMGMYDICLIILSVVFIIFTFLVIRGKTKAQRSVRQRQQELIKIHKNEVQARMHRMQQLRNKMDNKQKMRHVSPLLRMNRKWDDGRPTNQEIIDEFRK